MIESPMKIDATQIVNDVSKPFTGSLADAWQWLMGDKISHWRLQNAAKLQIKTSQELAALGLKVIPGNIPDRYAFAWFEEATKQDEDEIQTLFARLLAKAATGDQEALDRRLLEIVSRMVPGDAVVLNFFFECELVEKSYGRDKSDITDLEVDEYQFFKAVRDKFSKQAWLSVEHLMALGVLDKRHNINSDSLTEALLSLQADRFEGQVFLRYGSRPELVVEARIGSMGVGMSLYRLLNPAAPRMV